MDLHDDELYRAIERAPLQRPFKCVRRGAAWFPPESCAAMLNDRNARIDNMKERVRELEEGIKANIKSYEQSGYVAQSVKALKELIK